MSSSLQALIILNAISPLLAISTLLNMILIIPVCRDFLKPRFYCFFYSVIPVKTGIRFFYKYFSWIPAQKLVPAILSGEPVLIYKYSSRIPAQKLVPAILSGEPVLIYKYSSWIPAQKTAGMTGRRNRGNDKLADTRMIF